MAEWYSIVYKYKGTVYIPYICMGVCIYIYTYMCIYIYIHHILFIHSSVSEHLGCLHVLAIANSAAMNNEEHASFWITVLSSSMPRSGTVGPVWASVTLDPHVIMQRLFALPYAPLAQDLLLFKSYFLNHPLPQAWCGAVSEDLV